MTVTPQITPELVFYLVLVVTGLISRAYVMSLSAANIDAMRASGINGTATRLSRYLLLSERLSAGAWSTLVFLGVIALFNDQPPRYPLTTFGLLILLALLAAISVFLIKNFVDLKLAIDIRHEARDRNTGGTS